MSKRYCENCKNVIDETDSECSQCLMPVDMMDRWPCPEPVEEPALTVDWKRRSTDKEGSAPNNMAECTSCHHEWATDCMPFKCPECGCNRIYTTISNGVAPIKEGTPMDTQVGGSHYKEMAIQPAEFNQRNKIPYCEANAIKYICRHRSKNGVEDIDKAIHYLEMLKEMEYGN